MSAITVSKLVRYLKNKLDGDTNLQSITVIGELSNFHRHNSGHLYFTLKDESAAINCVMFKSSAASLTFEPKTGDKVIVSANTSLFETTGQLQLYVLKISLDGEGELYQKYEMLKKKLEVNGIFDSSHKIELEKTYLDRVAVLVGDKSAAMSDIKTCFKRRWPICKVDYYPVLVQGIDAPKDIIKTLNKVDDLDYEMIILARGGGSFEDLFCFNNEDLVKTIYNLKTFIVTGIGHEQDFTLADFVADLRAPTPTASVELITYDIKDISIKLDELVYSLNMNISNYLNQKSLVLDYLSSKLKAYKSNLSKLENTIDLSLVSLNNNIDKLIEIKKDKVNLYSNLIKAYSIDNTLKRGYSLVYKDDNLIKNKEDLNIEDKISIRLYGGNIKAEVKEA